MTMLENDSAFEAALEECCRRVAAGEALEACLADHPAAYRGELARLVPIAGRVSHIAREPSATFQARLERDLLARVDDARRAERRRVGYWLRRLSILRAATVAAVALLILFGGGVEVIQASDDVLPDSPLYQVKSARERLRLFFTRDPDTRVVVHATNIAKRGRELERAVALRKPRDVVEDLAVSLAGSVQQITDTALLLAELGNPRAPRRAHEAVQRMQMGLDRLIERAPPVQQPALLGLRAELERSERRLAPRLT